MFNPRETLLALEFDNTITDEDATEAVLGLAPDGELPPDLKGVHSKVSHPLYMETVLKYYKNHGITSEHVLRRLKKIQLAPGMKELMLDIYNSEQEAIILSDSNQAFIDFILKSHNLGGVFHPCNVYTNYSCLDQTNDLFKMRARDSQKDCDICPPNFCKGKMLMRHMKFRKERGLKTIRIIYVGSERTGMCPCLRLGSQDIVFCRKSDANKQFLLEKMLLCEMAKPAEECKLYADIRFYTDGYKIRRLMRITNVCFPARTMTPPTPPTPPSPPPCNRPDLKGLVPNCPEIEWESESTEIIYEKSTEEEQRGIRSRLKRVKSKTWMKIIIVLALAFIALRMLVGYATDYPDPCEPKLEPLYKDEQLSVIEKAKVAAEKVKEKALRDPLDSDPDEGSATAASVGIFFRFF